ncbi:hypothetical protein C8R43DRAFT_1114787 [Mycena crocata]|nr:hypothetical protein C8R43DRAFT_1114787 [Mycena crocata]
MEASNPSDSSLPIDSNPPANVKGKWGGKRKGSGRHRNTAKANAVGNAHCSHCPVASGSQSNPVSTRPTRTSSRSHAEGGSTSAAGPSIATNPPAEDNAAHDEDTVLHDQLAAVLERIQQEEKDHGRPLCYFRGDFYDRAPHPLFTLSSANLKPRLHDIFLWLPYLLPGAPDLFKCTCGKSLSRNGFPDDPIARRVRDVPSDFYLLTNRFVCDRRRANSNGCGTCYNGTDPHIIGQLPRVVQEAFPAYLSARSAVSKLAMQQQMGIAFATAARGGPAQLNSERVVESQRRFHVNGDDPMPLNAPPAQAERSSFETVDHHGLAGSPEVRDSTYPPVSMMRVDPPFNPNTVQSVPGPPLPPARQQFQTSLPASPDLSPPNDMLWLTGSFPRWPNMYIPASNSDLRWTADTSSSTTSHKSKSTADRCAVCVHNYCPKRHECPGKGKRAACRCGHPLAPLGRVRISEATITARLEEEEARNQTERPES